MDNTIITNNNGKRHYNQQQQQQQHGKNVNILKFLLVFAVSNM